MKRVWQDALQRAYDTLFHPSVQWVRHIRSDYRVFRYPAPSSEPIDYEELYYDYKTAYKDSIHNVRNLEWTTEQFIHRYVADPITESVPEKLVRMQLINKSQMNDSEAIKKASQQYEQKYGWPVEKKVYIDEQEVGQLMGEGPLTRERIAYFVRESFEEVNETNRLETMVNDMNMLYRPQLNEKISYHMNANDPVMRQLVIDLHYTLDSLDVSNKERGQQTFFKGDPNFWHVLDNSFSPEQISLVQGVINDRVSNTDTNALQKYHNKNTHHKESVQNYPIKTNYIQ